MKASQLYFTVHSGACKKDVITFNPMVYLIWYMLIFLQRVNKSSSEMELKINYAPISLGKLRIWGSLYHSLNSMKDLGMEVIPIIISFCEYLCEEIENIACPEILWPRTHSCIILMSVP